MNVRCLFTRCSEWSARSPFSELGRGEDAQKSVSEILGLDPDFSIKKYMGELSYRDPAESARFEDGLRKAGLPE